MKEHVAYLAAPLFTDGQRHFNLHLAKFLEPTMPVFLPQRDGLLLTELLARGIELRAAERQVFYGDLAAMHDSRLLIAVLDGNHIDEGVAFEIGYMFSRGDKFLVGLQTTTKRALSSGNNPMIATSLNLIHESVDDLHRWLAEFVRTEGGF